jgi:ribosomal protein S18 acetylase RimI-like enzyme
MFKNMYLVLTFLGFTTGLMNSAEMAIEPKQDVSEQDLVIQEMQEQDIEAIKALFQKSPDIGSYTFMNADFSRYLKKESRSKVYLCKNRRKEEVCAFLCAVNQDKAFYVRGLGVDKDYRRLGIATKLLQYAYDFAEQNNYDKLTINAGYEKARKCYDKFGFRLDSATGDLTISFMKPANKKYKMSNFEKKLLKANPFL